MDPDTANKIKGEDIMKTKKLLALLLAMSMLATTVATTTVFANGSDDSLVDISSTATMSTNGNDSFWSVSQVVDGKYATEENSWATGGNDENGQWKDWYGGLWAAEDGQYIQADFGETQTIREIEILGTNPWAWTGAGKVKTIHLSNDPNFARYEEMTCTERVAADNADWAQYVDHKSYWSYSGNTAYRYARVYGTPGPYETMTYGSESDNPDAFIIHEMKVYAVDKSDDTVNPEIEIVDVNMGTYEGKACRPRPPTSWVRTSSAPASAAICASRPAPAHSSAAKRPL
ncbi:MAG: hypothetical protein IJO88_06795 [Oscillospiraceae bacterium]|nr:hypothetical protein [Oscillospiraceae bacterium]